MPTFRVASKTRPQPFTGQSAFEPLLLPANRPADRSPIRAFSVVEVVMARGVVGMLASGSSLLADASERHIKARISQFVHEELVEMPFSDLAGTLGSKSYSFDVEGSVLPNGSSDVRYIAEFGQPEAPEIAAGQPLANAVRIPVNVDYAPNGSRIAGRQSTFFVLINNRGR
jgi:hypothetical protein